MLAMCAFARTRQGLSRKVNQTIYPHDVGQGKEVSKVKDGQRSNDK